MRQVFVTSFLLLIFAFLTFAVPAQADPSSVITIGEARAPDAAHFGVAAKEEVAPWLLSDAATTLLVEQTKRLRVPVTITEKSVLLPALLAASEGERLPEGWMASRLDALYFLGAPGEAWRLYAALPPSLTSESSARAGMQAAWLAGQGVEACKGVVTWLGKGTDSFWAEQNVLCQLAQGNQQQAELSYQLLSETNANDASGLLAALVEENASLPPSTPADRNILPAFSSMLAGIVGNSALAGRMPPIFLDILPVAEMPAPLLGQLAAVEKLPIAKRCEASEYAYRMDSIAAPVLRQVYQAALSSKNATGACARANLLAAIGLATDPAARTNALTHAVEQLRGYFTDRQLRSLLIEELRELGSRLPNATASTFILMQAALAEIEIGDRQGALYISQYLGRKGTMQAFVAGYAIYQAVALRFAAANDTTPPDLEHFPFAKPDDSPATIRYRERLTAVLNAMGYSLPPQIAADPPLSASDAPYAMLHALQQLKPSHADVLQLDKAENASIATLIKTMLAADMRAEAQTLAIEAMLTPPN